MSTPAYKKLARQREHEKQKQRKKYEALLATVKKTKKEFEPYVPPVTYKRETVEIPSLSDTIPMGVCAPPERKVYTGTLIKGIATMHKSNAIPILNKEQAVEVSQMRRN